MKVGAPVTDITAGILAALGVASALFERQRTGRGRLVDTSLLEAGITQTFWQSAIALAGGGSPGPLGSAHPLSAPYQAFRTADGWINVGASNQGTWIALTRALGRPGLAEDERFADNAGRMANLEALVEVLGPLFLERASDDWLAALAAEGVPAGPIASVGEMLEHPQTIARGMVTEVEHATAGRVRSLGAPVKLWSVEVPPSEAVGPTGGRGAPLLGQHTRAVLHEAGLADEEIDGLLERGDALQA